MYVHELKNRHAKTDSLSHVTGEMSKHCKLKEKAVLQEKKKSPERFD